MLRVFRRPYSVIRHRTRAWLRLTSYLGDIGRLNIVGWVSTHRLQASLQIPPQIKKCRHSRFCKGFKPRAPPRGDTPRINIRGRLKTRFSDGLFLPVQPLVAGVFGLGEAAVEGGGVVVAQHLFDGFELFTLAAHEGDQAFAVVEADVAPEFGGAGCEAGEVAEAAGGVFEAGGGVGAGEDLGDVGEGEQVRQVGDGGEHGVVGGGVHAADFRAGGLPEFGGACFGLRVLRLVRADDELFAGKQAVPCRRRAVAFGTGDGMGGDAVRQMLRQVCGEGGEGGLFGAAGVADDGFRRELRGEGAARSALLADGEAIDIPE